MLVTLLGISMLVSPVQTLNAELPMLVTLFGITILVSSVQPWNVARHDEARCPHIDIGIGFVCVYAEFLFVLLPVIVLYFKSHGDKLVAVAAHSLAQFRIGE